MLLCRYILMSAYLIPTTGTFACIYYNINTISAAPFLSGVILAFISTRLMSRIGKIEAPDVYILYCMRLVIGYCVSSCLFGYFQFFSLIK